MATRFSNDIRGAGEVRDGEYVGVGRGYSVRQVAMKARVMLSRFTTAAVATKDGTPWLNTEPLILLPFQGNWFIFLGGDISLSATLGAGRTCSVGTYARDGGGTIVPVDAARYGTALALTTTALIPYGQTQALRYLAEETQGAQMWLGLLLAGGDAANGVDVRVRFNYASE